MNKLCDCGCGKEVKLKNSRFINGHNRRNKNHTVESKLKISKSCLGLKWSEETRLIMSKNHKGMLGKHHSEETKLKLSMYVPWSKGKTRSKEAREKSSKTLTGRSLSIEHKKKLRIAAIKRMSRQFFHDCAEFPNIGKNERLILNELENKTGIELLKNDYHLALRTGRFMDGYSLKYNIAIDILEQHHFNINNELKDYDKNRETEIANELACMIYYISEKEFLTNPEKEIQRFIDFISLLNVSVN